MVNNKIKEDVAVRNVVAFIEENSQLRNDFYRIDPSEHHSFDDIILAANQHEQELNAFAELFPFLGKVILSEFNFDVALLMVRFNHLQLAGNRMEQAINILDHLMANALSSHNQAVLDFACLARSGCARAQIEELRRCYSMDSLRELHQDFCARHRELDAHIEPVQPDSPRVICSR